MQIKTVAFACLLVLPWSNVWGEIVKWTDEKGKVHFSDGDSVPEKYKKKSKKIVVSESNIANSEHYQPPKPKHHSDDDFEDIYSRKEEEEEKAKAKAFAAKCKKSAEFYKMLTVVNHGRKNSNGVTHDVNTVYAYPLKKDGSMPSDRELKYLKSNELMTRKEQNKYAERLRRKWNRKGCSISQTPNLKM